MSGYVWKTKVEYASYYNFITVITELHFLQKKSYINGLETRYFHILKGKPFVLQVSSTSLCTLHSLC